MASHHDGHCLRVGLFDGQIGLQAIYGRQLHVDEDDVIFLLSCLSNSLFASRNDTNPVVLFGQYVFQGEAGLQVIVNHQDERALLDLPRPLNESYYLFDVKGLVEYRRGSFLQRLLNQGFDCVGGHHHHHRFRPYLLHPLIGLHAVHKRHLDVHKNYVEWSFLDPFKSLRSVLGSGDGVALAPQDKGQGLAQADIVIHYQDANFLHSTSHYSFS